MKLKKKDIDKLCLLAISAASKAGQMISDSSQKTLEIQTKTGGDTLASQVVTEIDYKSQEIIIETLKSSILECNLGLLSEESTDDQSRFNKDYFWCIDPLDGTLPFTEAIPGYAVSIALLSHKGVPVLGVVFDPITKNLYHAVQGGGVFKNRKKWHGSQFGSNLKFYSDRSFLNLDQFENVRVNLAGYVKDSSLSDLEIKATGGAVMNAIWVMENPAACYFKFPKKEKGGGSLWDFAATTCILKEAGMIVSDIHGNPLQLNCSESTFMNQNGILIASDKKLAERIMNDYRQGL